MSVYMGNPLPSTPYERARRALAALSTPEGFVLGDVIARLVLDSGIVIPAEPLCRDCGAPWHPVRRGECSQCGSDAGPAPVSSGEAATGEACGFTGCERPAGHEWAPFNRLTPQDPS